MLATVWRRRAAGLLLAASLFHASPPVAAHEPAVEMAAAAKRFLGSLAPEQEKQATLAMNDSERTDWQFLPDRFIKPDANRAGLPLRDMAAEQRLLAHALVASALSHRGYLDAMAIAALEVTLREIEGGNPIRDPSLYYVAIFGEPGAARWGWRFEGHHLSINLTIADGKVVAATPAFFGANPAVVNQGSGPESRALPLIQSLARNLVTSLDARQCSKAIITDGAPEEILTGWTQRVNKSEFLPPAGIAYSDLNPTQQDLLRRLIAAHCGRFRSDILGGKGAAIPAFQASQAYFAWAGALAEGQGHYYRIQTAGYLIEYDNTQNDANHIHSVVRRFDGDFGRDVLGDHLEAFHKPAPGKRQK